MKKGEDIIIGKTEIQKYTANGESFKVGVISDTQLPPTKKTFG